MPLETKCIPGGYGRSLGRRRRDHEPAALPLPAEGLSEKQRQEVLRLMGGVLNTENQETPEAD